MATPEIESKAEERDRPVTASGLSDPISSGNSQQRGFLALRLIFWVSQNP